MVMRHLWVAESGGGRKWVTDVSQHYATPYLALHPRIRGVAFAATIGTYKSESQIVPSCTTGNCSFAGFQSGTPQFDVGKEATHASAGICSVCTDVTSLMGSGVDPELPNGMKLHMLDFEAMKFGDGNLSWATAVMSPEALHVSGIALANVTVLSATRIHNPAQIDPPDSINHIAVSCSIYTCLRSYSGNVFRGQLSETVISTTPMYADLREHEEDPEEPTGWNYTALQSPCLVDNKVYTVSNMSEGPNLTTMRPVRRATAPDYPSIRVPRQCVYDFGSTWAGILARFIRSDLFYGTCTIDYWSDSMDIFAQCNGTDWIPGFFEGGDATTESIEHHFSDFTNTFTNELRMGLTEADDGVTIEATGEAYQLVPFTSIEKQWLVFPIFMVILEVFLLSWVIARGWWRKDEEAVWKSNVLPLLYYTDRFRGTAGDDGAAWLRLMTTRQMEDGAEDVKVQFSRKGWRQHDDVSLEQMLPPQRNS